jgi:serine phosphatase RsbU (regulator of sigma subunit)
MAFLFSLVVQGQQVTVKDSLLNVLRSGRSDKEKADAMFLLARSYRKENISLALKYSLNGLALSKLNGYEQGIRDGYLITGIVYAARSDFGIAQEYYDSLAVLARKADDNVALGDYYYQSGLLDYYKGNYTNSLEKYFSALGYYEKAKDSKGFRVTYNMIGSAYYSQRNYKKALEFYEKSLELARAENNLVAIASLLDNLAVVYDSMGEKGKALDYQLQALSIFEKLGKKAELAVTLNNIGNQYRDRGMYEKSLEHLERSLAIRTEIEDRKGMSSALNNIGNTYRLMGQYEKAQDYLYRAANIAMQIGARPQLADAYENIAKNYEGKNDFKKAYEYVTLFHNMQDSLLNEETAQQMADAEAKYENQKKESEIQLLKKETEIRELESNKKLMGLSLGVLLLLTFAGLVYYNLRQKKAANRMLQQQNKEIIHQKQEITDSINYARRIQESILPPDSYVKSRLEDSFILYKPKDIVSGDFYWVEKMNDYAVFAAVDCTGHGVPGALMSVVGFNILNQAVNERQLVKPSEILAFLDAGVNNMLRQSTEMNSVKDGMDLALCSLNPERNLLQYAGAYNSLYIVQDNQLKEIKADKFPIGVNLDGRADTYTNHEVPVKKGDCVYLFSDGYADQFGGPLGKKYKYNTFRKLLLEVHHKPMDEQRAILDRTIEEWRGELEQVDDILVMGIRI